MSGSGKESGGTLASDRIPVDASILHNVSGNLFAPGSGRLEWFKDHESGPEMVVVPEGRVTMGSPETEPEREAWQKGTEGPLHLVAFAKPFAVARHATTKGQFNTFIGQTGYAIEPGGFAWSGKEWKRDGKLSWTDPGFHQDNSHPVVCVDWADAKAYAAWLSAITGKRYRLLAEAEREYVTRAGTETPFWWGSALSPEQANYDSTSVYLGGGTSGPSQGSTLPVGHFKANPWGLFDVHGNIREWCEDVWHDSYFGAPSDGAVWVEGGDASRRCVRGGGWDYGPMYLRAAYRDWSVTANRATNLGFRVARELESKWSCR